MHRLAVAFMVFGVPGLLTGQSPAHSQTLSVGVHMEKEHPASPEEVNAILMIRNVSQRVVVETGDNANYRLHLSGPQGEPPRTNWYRRLLAGELAVTLPAFPRDIPPGSSVNRTYRLSSFYDLRSPGRYTIYLEVHDASGIWVETNEANFELSYP